MGEAAVLMLETWGRTGGALLETSTTLSSPMTFTSVRLRSQTHKFTIKDTRLFKNEWSIADTFKMRLMWSLIQCSFNNYELMCFSLLNKNSCLCFDFKFSLKEICVLFDVLNTFILKSESSECQKEVWKKLYIHTFAATELKYRVAWQTGVNGKTVLSFFLQELLIGVPQTLWWKKAVSVKQVALQMNLAKHQ